MINERKIQSGNELHEWFFATRNNDRLSSVMVDNNVRKDVLLGNNQGKITIDGTVKRIQFDNKTGGVWLAKLVKLND